ncbi:MAG: histidinol dehydrogenase [Actinobacteria bacterium]|nr:histidinol dehydrogenase [Actinomycetota bacterium]
MLELIDGREQLAPVHIPRPETSAGGIAVAGAVAGIISEVRLHGDEAVRRFTAEFDGAEVTELKVPEGAIAAAGEAAAPELIEALRTMAERLRSTCERQVIEPWMDRRADESVGELVRPLRRVGLYVPGGRAAYPSSVIMTAIPAQIAGVEQLAVASPPGPDGEVSPAVLAACSVAGISEVYRMGGAQAIAALAYGTDLVRPVEKIVGPGNLYVTEAKRQVRGWCGIDSEAGPTEIAIVADGSADPAFVAADLIAQAEHGPDGAHVLITWSPQFAEAVLGELDAQVIMHPRTEEVEDALVAGGTAVLVRDLRHALETVNAFAPEHLELIFDRAEDALPMVQSAGSVFVGPYTPVPVGDYTGSTNHVLPSGGTARWSSGLSVRDFIKVIYVSGMERSALERMEPHIDALAEAEGLPAHIASVRLRLGDPS